MKNNRIQCYKIDNKCLTIFLSKSEYDYIESIAKLDYKDRRSILGVIKTYAIIKCYSSLNQSFGFIPIRCELFRNGVSAKNYTAYQDCLIRHNIIEVKREEKDTYTDVAGKKHLICISPRRFKIILLSISFSSGIYFKQDLRQIPVKIELPEKELISFQIKSKAIMEGINDGFQPDKIDNLMDVSDNEVFVMSKVIQLIKDVYSEKVKSQATFDKRIRAIAKHYQTDSPLKTREYKLSILVYKVLISLYQIRSKKKEIIIEHIVSNYLCNCVDNQLDMWVEKRRNTNGKLAYYSDLSIDIEGLDYCVRLTDLYHIARISEIPKYTYPEKKLYSKLAGLRRSIRKFVRYKDERIVEVSDIHSAHYTMLPVLFKKCGIEIPEEELHRFVILTQQGDLYQTVASYSSFSRNEIKPTFQPFFSIKNEKSFLFNRQELDRQKRQLICDFFNKHYPAIYSALLNFHLNHNQTIKSVANSIESSLINPICDRIRHDGLHPFRIHDAIYLPSNEYKQLTFDITEEVFNAINTQIGYYPNIVCKMTDRVQISC